MLQLRFGLRENSADWTLLSQNKATPCFGLPEGVHEPIGANPNAVYFDKFSPILCQVPCKYRKY